MNTRPHHRKIQPRSKEQGFSMKTKDQAIDNRYEDIKEIMKLEKQVLG